MSIQNKEINEISRQLLMTDPLIYPCLVLLVKLLHEKQPNKQQEFYHTHLLVKHFIQSKQIFQNKPLLYQNFLIFYQQISVSLQQPQRNPNSIQCLQQFQKLNHVNDLIIQNEKSLYQIVAKMIIIGVHTVLNLQVDPNISQQIIHHCQQLHMDLAFQGISISQILLKFIPDIAKQIKNLIFYENLLKIFLRLDYYQIINLLEQTIHKFRQNWQKDQQKIPLNIVKKKRQTVFLPSPQRNISIQKPKQNQQKRQNFHSVHKDAVKSKQNIHTNFKKVQTTQKVPPSSRRRTFYQGNKYEYNGHVKNQGINSSKESISFQEPKHQKKQNHWKNLKYQNKYTHISSQAGSRFLQNEPQDILAGSTPKRKKMEKKN